MDVMRNGNILHVQDVDNINTSALVGVVDGNGMVFDADWVAWSELVVVGKS
jgi:hypothetical protein